MQYSFSIPTLGSSISVNDKLLENKAFLLVFVSTFCSRCIILKKSIKRIENSINNLPVVFVDIATKGFLDYKLKIELVPAVLLVKNKYILFFKEGILSESELMWIFNLGKFVLLK